MSECPVCINTMDGYGSRVVCPFCGYTACKSCTQCYIFSRENTVVHCMETECKSLWPLEFMGRHFGIQKVYNGSYTQRLPIAHVRVRLEELDAEAKLVRAVLHQKKTQKKGGLLCPCPEVECKGLVEIKTHQCTLCRTELCKKCRAPLTSRSRHDCCGDDLLTIDLLRQDTKSCPVCAVPIHKIRGGCDQMCCVQCQTAFSWTSGKLDKGFIHNPHSLRPSRSKQVFLLFLLYWCLAFG